MELALGRDLKGQVAIDTTYPHPLTGESFAGAARTPQLTPKAHQPSRRAVGNDTGARPDHCLSAHHDPSASRIANQKTFSASS